MKPIDIKSKRDSILQLAHKYGVERIRLFGSVARGEAVEGSDVDFLIEMQPDRSLMDLAELSVALETLLSCRVDLVEPEGLHWYVRERVLKEAIPL